MAVNDVNIRLDARTSSALELAAPTPPRGRPMTLEPLDVQAVRLMLDGGSVVDWRRLTCTDPSHVKSFLAVNGFDVDNPIEMARLEDLHRRAVAYVAETFDTFVPAVIAAPHDFCDLFMAASGEDSATQRAACVVLKVMHVINHLESRRLIHHMSVSERALFEAAADKVEEFIERMRAEGMGIMRYDPSRKSDHSLVTKLLSKPRVTAAQIFDKLRFRMVVAERADLVPVMLWLLRHLFPFNHVIAGESHNTILSADEIRSQLDGGVAGAVPMWLERDGQPGAAHNPATSPRFRMINFVVELPIRIRRLCSDADRRRHQDLGHLVLVTLEFQLFDEATAVANERGDGNHAAYKARQLDLVGRRLWGGDPPPLKQRSTR